MPFIRRTKETVSGCLAVCLSVSVCRDHTLQYLEDSESAYLFPDIVAYDPDGHTTTDVDISMAHPHSGDTLRHAALKSGYAAELREQRKVKKYGQQQS